jgi:hypothetical protein
MKIRVGRERGAFPPCGSYPGKKPYIQIISEFLTTSLITPDNGKLAAIPGNKKAGPRLTPAWVDGCA